MQDRRECDALAGRTCQSIEGNVVRGWLDNQLRLTGAHVTLKQSVIRFTT